MNAQPEPPRTRLRASLDDTRRVAAYVVVLFAIGLAVLYFVFHVGRQDTPHSASVKTPALTAPAGGNNQSPRLDDITSQQEKKNAEDAARKNQSYTPALSGRDLPREHHIAELGDPPGTTKPTDEAQNKKPPAPVTPPPSGSKPSAREVQPAPKPPPSQVNDPFSNAPATSATPAAKTLHANTSHEEPAISLAAQAELIAAWSGHGSQLEMMLPDDDSRPSTRRGNSIASSTASTIVRADAFGRSAENTNDSGAQTSPAGSASQSSHAGQKPMLAAGRGVYGHSVITSNSDLGDQVLVEIDSGPFPKARISGAFQMKNDRLVIKLDRLMIGDTDPIAVSAYAVSPKTAETGVASEVDEHLATRIILPTAAAFVEGLGNAMMSANTTSYTGGYGMTSFTHLNLAQQMGAASGRMGEQLSQVLQKQTAQQATVKLKQGDEVGVLFDEPVYAP
ncbi:TrbI/VirB10 family protein [Komagataeibacter sp. FNDCR2]|uniref:TrbI/VirB10 family protein n=1 Tax=Komagataeibacter sp. FNDCR2 TaxID=2878682 RepID=UPI001E656EED|nr:hypothetical protein [Komagataeibacter sp. FNDCR2]